MTTDLDALEALYRDDKSRPVGTIGQADVLALISELRQERERADDLYAANVGLVDAVYATDAALSRAEETIDRALSALDPSTGDGAALDEARTILTEYGKQKGAKN